MKDFYIINEDGYPVRANNETEWAIWAVQDKRIKGTYLGVGKDGIPLYVITDFNYREGYFMTFKFNGGFEEELGKSENKHEAEETHEKWVAKLSLETQ